MPEAPPPGGGAAALEELRRTVDGQPHGTILLAGPATPARRRLLEALAGRLREGLAGVCLEGGDLAPSAIWTQIAAALGVTPGYDARRRVLHLLGDRVARQGGLVVLVPEAEALAADSLGSLVNNARSERGLHVILAAASAGALAAALPEDATTIAWDGEPLAGVAAARPAARAGGAARAERSPAAPAFAEPPKERSPVAPASAKPTEERSPVTPAIAGRAKERSAAPPAAELAEERSAVAPITERAKERSAAPPAAEPVAPAEAPRPAHAAAARPGPPPEAPLRPPAPAGLGAGAASPVHRAPARRRPLTRRWEVLVVLAGGVAFAFGWCTGQMRSAQHARGAGTPPAAERAAGDVERPLADAAPREPAREGDPAERPSEATAKVEPTPAPPTEAAPGNAPESTSLSERNQDATGLAQGSEPTRDTPALAQQPPEPTADPRALAQRPSEPTADQRALAQQPSEPAEDQPAPAPPPEAADAPEPAPASEPATESAQRPVPTPEATPEAPADPEPSAATEPDSTPSEPAAAATSPSREPESAPAEEPARDEPAAAQQSAPPTPESAQPAPPATRAARPAPTPPPAPPPLARGRLRIESEVPVRIEIDGRPYGRTPLAGIRLPRGRHRVVARYPDGATAQKSVTLDNEDVAISYR